jgi:hypothetical protein
VQATAARRFPICFREKRGRKSGMTTTHTVQFRQCHDTSSEECFSSINRCTAFMPMIEV